jgi:hypothetical protein
MGPRGRKPANSPGGKSIFCAAALAEMAASVTSHWSEMLYELSIRLGRAVTCPLFEQVVFVSRRPPPKFWAVGDSRPAPRPAQASILISNLRSYLAV